MKLNRTFPSKLLLFGEYSLLIGSDALAVPYRGHSGRFIQSDMEADKRLLLWLAYLKKDQKIDFLDLDKMRVDFLSGVRFESDIPQGYGVGSSGALCAAVYARYCIDKSDLEISLLKERLSIMENFFHQNSSGIDPLVSYLDNEILLHNKIWQPILHIGGDEMCRHLFLLDSGYARHTSPLVMNFKKMIQNAEFKEELNTKYIPLVNSAIQNYVNNEVADLFTKMNSISRWQIKHFGPMIPDHILSLFEGGMRNNSYRLKICGAGGGGYFLGMSMDREETEKSLEGEKIVWL